MTITSALKRKLKSVGIAFSLLFLMFSFQNFSEVNVDEHPELNANDMKGSLVSELFNKEHVEEDSHVDLIIFMESEVSTKNKNIEKEISDFIIKTETSTNLNVALFSNSKNNSILSKDQIKKGYLQFNHKKNLASFLSESVKFMPELIKTGFLREDSKKILILIGKDDFKSGKSDLTNEQFINQMGAYVDMDEVSLFSFVGLGSELSDCAPVTGVRAMDLASNLKGAAFNVCDQNWSNHLQQISSSIARVTKNKFLLSSMPSQKIAVKVDGVLTDNYSIVGNSVVLNKSHYSEEKNYIVQVDYLTSTHLISQK